MIVKWKTIAENQIFDLKIFKANSLTRENPITGNISDYTVLKSPDWANVIPINAEGKIIMVEQYRHGTDEITLELPGGLVEIGESPLNAAKRECQEETGFIGEGEPILLGSCKPNPAFLSNTCYSYLWENCSIIDKQKLDTNEIIKLHFFTQYEIKKMIEEGVINHSIILTAFFFYNLKYGI